MGVADGIKVLIKTEIINIPRILPDKTDALYSSLYNKEFLVWYQPIFDIRSYGTYLCVKAEALLRLYSNGEVFSAYQFIDSIKKHPEFRFSLSKFVVSRVIEDSKKAYSIRLSVNLFSEDLEDDLFVDWFLSAIDKLNHEEIADLEELISQLYNICEPTRIDGYSDDQMFEANAPFEFAVTIVQQIQSEIIALGHPLPATLLNAMENPYSLEVIKQLGIVPEETTLLGISDVHRFLSGNNVSHLIEG